MQKYAFALYIYQSCNNSTLTINTSEDDLYPLSMKWGISTICYKNEILTPEIIYEVAWVVSVYMST